MAAFGNTEKPERLALQIIRSGNDSLAYLQAFRPGLFPHRSTGASRKDCFREHTEKIFEFFEADAPQG